MPAIAMRGLRGQGLNICLDIVPAGLRHAASRNKGPAWLFMQWATSEPTARYMAYETGMPLRTSTWEDPVFQESVN